MNPDYFASDQEILSLLADATSPASQDAAAVDQLLDTVPGVNFSETQLRSIWAGTGFSLAPLDGLDTNLDTAAGQPLPLDPVAATFTVKKAVMSAAGMAAVGLLYWATYRPVPVAEGMQRYSTFPPDPVFVSSPLPIIDAPNVEPVPPSTASFDAPPGLENLATMAAITTSANISPSDLSRVNDGQKGSQLGRDLVFLGSGPQHLTVDLGKPQELFTLVLWHRFDTLITYRDVLVEASDEANFATSRILYNNDHDNTLGRGPGKDRGYVETNFGRVIELTPANKTATPTKARWLRVWSNGNQNTAENHYSEIEIWGRR